MNKDSKLIFEAYDDSETGAKIKSDLLVFIQAYLDEAEHQEGMGYYAMFKDESDPVSAILQDLVLGRGNGLSFR